MKEKEKRDTENWEESSSLWMAKRQQARGNRILSVCAISKSKEATV
jgi:hypothetical protein